MEEMRKNKGNVPNLRFPGFKEDWNECSVKDLGIFSGGGTPPSTNVAYWSGNIPWVSSSDISENNIHSINIRRFISNEAVEKSPTKLCSAPSILVVSRVGVGKVALSMENICTSQDFLNISDLKGDAHFLTYLMSRLMKTEASNVQGTSIKGITSSAIKAKKILLPSQQEQEKIGTMLRVIDARIETQSKIIKELEALNVKLRNDVFLQKINVLGKVTDWKKLRLGDYLVKYEGKTISNNQYPILTSARTGLYFQKDYFDGNEVASSDNIGYNIVPRGYFTYRHMSDDVTFKFNKNELCDYGIVSTLYPVFTTQGLNDEFLKAYLNDSPQFKAFAKSQKQGGSRTYMYYSKLKDLEVTFPEISEQNKIAEILKCAEEKIDLERAILIRYKIQKQFLLKQMFI